MAEARPRLDLRIFGAPRRDPGYIYIVEDRGRYKIGKCKSPAIRLKAAKTWLPDAKLLACKPFWNVSHIERNLHVGLSDYWRAGEWFEFSNHYDRDLVMEGFLEFSDTDRDTNSVDFIYWFNGIGMADFVREQQQQRLSLPKFLRQALQERLDRAETGGAVR